MASFLVWPGLQFYAEPMGVSRFNITPGMPTPNELYVICRDGSVQSVWNPESPVEWTLFEIDDEFFFSAPSGPAFPCFVRYHATSEDPPDGKNAPKKAPRPKTHFQLDEVAVNLDPKFATQDE